MEAVSRSGLLDPEEIPVETAHRAAPFERESSPRNTELNAAAARC